ncbi:MAG: isoprenylcysteine carboxylmethyltransferase family protein [Burkholderiales bacterium]|nr:isoprenylcysteine carboxylmethyltransferase family protein [Burkholderiales bacterium]
MLDAIHGFFNHPGLRTAFVKARVPLGVLVAGALLWFAQPQWFWAGFAVSMLGEFIQLWSFASLNKNVDLACNGPYALVRNPMYLGRYFIILGAVMLLGNPWLIGIYTLIYYFYMVNRVKREERRLRPALGRPYEEYCARVNRFLPGVPYRGNPVIYWRSELLRQNNGWANLAGTLVFWAAAAAIWLLAVR